MRTDVATETLTQTETELDQGKAFAAARPWQPSASAASYGRVAIAVAIIGATAVYVASLCDEQRPEFRLVRVPSGQTIRVEVARTAKRRSRGLGGRSEIGADGLLLAWPDAGEHPIWMASMRFALDLVWLDIDNRVVAIHSDARPCTATPCPLFRPSGGKRSVAVLELPSGDAARYLIAVGEIVTSRPETPDTPRPSR